MLNHGMCYVENAIFSPFSLPSVLADFILSCFFGQFMCVCVSSHWGAFGVNPDWACRLFVQLFLNLGITLSELPIHLYRGHFWDDAVECLLCLSSMMTFDMF